MVTTTAAHLHNYPIKTNFIQYLYITSFTPIKYTFLKVNKYPYIILAKSTTPINLQENQLAPIFVGQSQTRKNLNCKTISLSPPSIPNQHTPLIIRPPINSSLRAANLTHLSATFFLPRYLLYACKADRARALHWLILGSSRMQIYIAIYLADRV